MAGLAGVLRVLEAGEPEPRGAAGREVVLVEVVVLHVDRCHLHPQVELHPVQVQVVPVAGSR